jgi:hypothetical protein
MILLWGAKKRGGESFTTMIRSVVTARKKEEQAALYSYNLANEKAHEPPCGMMVTMATRTPRL